ncbi:MAG: pyruvate dehydrogenase (acetyl-transferring) E1 component subunit alpha [Acidobacteria bacterium]|jgi:pyruvate dehydrogenase E1 component alpha subunit|nr:pyruvate dehydrogenase (acetyl-transferring) E1 component subunit alpha [Acidobacteriota bacterium]|tara:strand:- start:2321 stop:3301 length:981 start_codon:yes stop_codon:yes gene_type:complete
MIDETVRLALYRNMVRARLFEQRVYDLFLVGVVQGTTHLGLGQEAIAAGFAAAMQSTDMTFCTYRGHNHTLLRGAPMSSLLGELAGKSTGVCAGKGGSMHLTDVSKNAMGSYAIVGAHLPIAVGAAWAGSLRGTDQVAVCFFGDGTTNIGAFHEAVNLAAVWRVPIVFVCENNLYMEYTPISDVIAVEHPAADRASAYGLTPIIVDGNDVDAVYTVALDVIGRARRGEGPALVEAKTYRHKGHSRTDPGKYRPEEEVTAWLARDPIPSYRARLEEVYTDGTRLDAIEAEAMREVDNAAEKARNASPPAPETLMTEVWADGGSRWRN